MFIAERVVCDVMGGTTDKPEGSHWDDEDHLLLRARMVRKRSVDWLPPRRDWPVLHSVLIKPPKHVGDKWLVVLKAETEEGYRVGFHKGSTLMVTLAQALDRCFSGRIDWKVETPYQPPRG